MVLKQVTARGLVLITGLFTLLAFSGLCVAKPTLQGEVRISGEDGLATTIFHTPTGGRVSVFLPLRVQGNEAEIGGTVERRSPPQQPGFTPQQADEATNEIAGDVTIERVKRQPKHPPIITTAKTPAFRCPVPGDGKYVVTYHPPHGASCSKIVDCPLMPPQPVKDTCGIPQLTTCGGNLPVSMDCQSGDPSNNTCQIGDQAAPCRAWSSQSAVFHVPAASLLPPGPQPVVVSRGDQTAVGQTHVAQVKLMCTPARLQSGQPVQIKTTVFCPGLQDVQNGVLMIKNYNPAVLNMAEKVIPIGGGGSSPTNSQASQPAKLNAEEHPVK